MTKKTKEQPLEEKLEQALTPEDEHPYEVPVNWCWTQLKYVSDIITGGTPSKSISEYYGGKFPFVKPADLDQGRNVVNASEYLSEDGKKVSRVVPQGSTSVCCIGSIGKSGFLEQESTTNQQINTVVPKINKLFMYYYLNTEFFINKLNSLSSATTIAIVNKSKMESIQIPIAPLAEQQRIVKQIENLFSKLDDVKEKVQEALESFETRRVAILHKAFTGELTAEWRKTHDTSKDNWRLCQLKELSSQIGDGLHGTPLFDDSGEYYFINGNNLAGQYIEIKPDTKKVGITEFKKYQKSLSSENTVFVSINGTLGKTGLYNGEPVVLGKSACYINVLPSVNKYFLRYFFETEEFIQYANDKATGSTIKNLGLKAIRELIIDLPENLEQQEIVRALDKLITSENHAKEVAEAVLDQIELMKKSILASAFRGKLGTNEKSEESSIELLKEILATE